MLEHEIRSLSKIKTLLVEVEINKTNPLEVQIPEGVNFDQKAVIVVDDVADSGKTMIYALKPLLRFNLKKLEVAVLIDREHKLFPVTSTYIGYEISTTVKDKIRVEVEQGQITAYLC
jgi:pyrimidine operon attenuation protein/uracil phosphoribosyltransferase